MSAVAQLLTLLHVENYRSLADVTLGLHPVNIFFGPNGAGSRNRSPVGRRP